MSCQGERCEAVSDPVVFHIALFAVVIGAAVGGSIGVIVGVRIGWEIAKYDSRCEAMESDPRSNQDGPTLPSV